jgi:diguanylate cyclase (GGDEF)-like protein/PAS domain S-box-containing protein
MVSSEHPSDPRQAVRMHSYLMAAGSSLLVMVLLLVWHELGMLRLGPLIAGLGLILGIVALFYWIFRTGWNLRWSDPSLTTAQMAAASITILGIAYGADGGRSIFLVLLVMTCLFGALRLRTRALVLHALWVISGYALVIGSLWFFRPHALDLKLELLHLLLLALILPWFALMGGYISDLRERLQIAFRTMADSERALAEAQRLAQFGSWTFDPANREAVWSEETYRIFGLDPSRRAIGGADFRALVHEEDRERYMRLIDKALGDGQEFDTEYRVALPSGAVRWVHALAQPIARAQGEGRLLRGMVMDITQRKATEERIRRMAHFDELTGLPNRNLLMQLLRHAVSKAQRGVPLAVLFIDLDGFKSVNDSRGHEIGDALLAAFAQRLGRALRMSDTAARLGGDEFVVVIDDFEGRTQVEAVAQRILLAAATPFQMNGHDCLVSASIGIAIHGPASSDVDSLVKNADTAMYAAKNNGKNGYRFHGDARVQA